MGQRVSAGKKPERALTAQNGNQSLDEILESAIVVSWADLMRGRETGLAKTAPAEAGLIHVEYGFAPGGTLDYLKVWSSITPGHWLLVCEYWMLPSTFHGTGISFDNGYQSEVLAHTLGFVMQHQDAFTLPANLGRQGLLQIPVPTPEESAASAASVNHAFTRLGAALAEPVLA
jgi:hypothetical protein